MFVDEPRSKMSLIAIQSKPLNLVELHMRPDPHAMSAADTNISEFTVTYPWVVWIERWPASC